MIVQDIKRSNNLWLLQTIITFVFICVVSKVAIAQVPIISYETPQIYEVGTPITPLLPTNIGGSIFPDGQVTTFAGSGIQGATNGQGIAAKFNYASAVAIDASGNVFVADYLNHIIRKITPTGLVSTFAGSGLAGSSDGVGIAASFNYPGGIAIDASGNLYIADCLNNKIRKITATGVVTTLAGNGSQGSIDGDATTASFYNPTGLAVDASGNVFVADCYNHSIRKVTPSGLVTTIAGSGLPGSIDAIGTAASFKYPTSLVIDTVGDIYVTDFLNHKIRKITTAAVVSTFVGSGIAGSGNGTGVSASFNKPKGVAIDNLGDFYVADSDNLKIRKITSAGVVTDHAGVGSVGAIDGSVATANFNYPTGLATDALGNVYVADFYNSKIRKISPNGYTISPDLPAGLVFDETTGEIKGTPTEASNETTYTITGYNGDGTSITTINITICAKILSPEVTISASDTSICAGINVVFTALPVEGGSNPIFQWEKNGLSVGTNSVTYTDNTLINNDVITCTLINNEICSTQIPATDSVTMQVYTTPLPSAESIQIFCDTALVSDLEAIGEELKWYASSTSNDLLSLTEYLLNGTYYVSQTSNGCESNRLNITVELTPLKTPDFEILQTLCAGDVAPILPLMSLNGISGTWSPSIIDNDVSSIYTFTPSAEECAVPIFIEITVNPITLISLDCVVSEAFTENQRITITALNEGDYWYQLNDGALQESNVFENVTSGIHTITVYDQNGCSLPIKKSDILIIDYPKFFTPNDDGYNDFWNIAPLGTQTNASISIFDRYGKLISKINPKGNGWDGRFNGDLMQANDYWFVVEYSENNIKKIFRSHFALKR